MSPSKRLTAALNHRVATMPFHRLVMLVVGVLAIAGSLAASARWAHETINHIPSDSAIAATYVRKDSFAVYQQGEAAVHQRDSLILDAKISRLTDHIDALYRACQNRKECQ